MSKEEQKELLAVLPQGVEIINKLTKSQKLVLAQIVLMYGMDYAADNNYVFRDNEKLMEDTGIKSNKTIITSVRVLQDLNLIERVSGKRGWSSTYTLTDYYFEVTGSRKPEKKGCNLGCNFEEKGCNFENNDKNIDIMGILEEMQQRISDLEAQVAELKGVKLQCKKGVKTENYTEIKQNYTTDSETETEIESDTDPETKKENIKQMVHVPLSDNVFYDDWIEIDDIDREEDERVKNDYLQWLKDNKNSCNGSSRELDNEYVSLMYDKFDKLLNEHFKSMSTVTAGVWNEKIQNFINGLNGEKSHFTDRQWDVISRKVEKWHKQQDDKDKYFNKQKAKNAASTVQSEYNTDTEAMVQDSISSIGNNEKYGGLQRQTTLNPKHFKRVGERVLEMLAEDREHKAIDDYIFNEFNDEYGFEWSGNSNVQPYYNVLVSAIWNGKADVLQTKLCQLNQSENIGGCAPQRQYTNEEYQQAVEKICKDWTMGKLFDNGFETTLGRLHNKVVQELNVNDINYYNFRNDAINYIKNNA